MNKIQKLLIVAEETEKELKAALTDALKAEFKGVELSITWMYNGSLDVSIYGTSWSFRDYQGRPENHKSCPDVSKMTEEELVQNFRLQVKSEKLAREIYEWMKLNVWLKEPEEIKQTSDGK